MVVDTSAIVALLLGEQQAGQIDSVLAGEVRTTISAANYVELMVVAESRTGAEGALIVEQLLRTFDVGIEPVSPDIARGALDGWRRFGKGRHPAALNFGDCFSYGLAISRDEPLLYVGNDFAQTDVTSALDG